MFWEFLKEFGFTSYELKALQGLLRLGVAIPSEISEAENIPSSKIYSALDRLESVGLVVKLSVDNQYRLADQYQIASIIAQLQRQKEQEFSDSLGNLSKYLSHQSQKLEKPSYSLLQGREQIENKLLFPGLEAPHDISIYWNIFDDQELAELVEFIQRWQQKNRNYTDRVLIYSTGKLDIELPKTRRLSIRQSKSYKGNSLTLWGQKQVGLVISSPAATHPIALDVSDLELVQSYATEFENWWFEGIPMSQS